MVSRSNQGQVRTHTIHSLHVPFIKFLICTLGSDTFRDTADFREEKKEMNFFTCSFWRNFVLFCLLRRPTFVIVFKFMATKTKLTAARQSVLVGIKEDPTTCREERLKRIDWLAKQKKNILLIKTKQRTAYIFTK